MNKSKIPVRVVVAPAALNLASVVLLAVAASFGTADAAAGGRGHGQGQSDMVCSRTTKAAF
jgi:hypothetical protein